MIHIKEKERKVQILSLLTEMDELTCEVRIKDKRMRTLIDTGASIALINSNAFKQLNLREALRKADLVACQADGSKIKMMV